MLYTHLGKNALNYIQNPLIKMVTNNSQKSRNNWIDKYIMYISRGEKVFKIVLIN